MGACRALQQPRVGLYDAKARAEWEAIYDRANAVRHTEATLRAVEQFMRRPGTGRRTDPRGIFSRRTVPLSAQFSGLFTNSGGGASDTWLDTGYRAVDGVTGKISDWIDYVDPTHTFQQTVSAKQCAVPATNGFFGTAPTAVFNTNPFYVSTRPPAAFKYTADGTGVDVCMVLRRTSTATSTHLGNAVTASPCLYLSHQSGAQYLLVGGPFGTWVVNNGAFALPLNVASYFEASFQKGATPEWSHGLKGAAPVTGSAGTPQAIDPLLQMTLGALSPAGGSPAIMDWYSLYMFRRVLNTAEKTVRRTWIQAQTSITP